MLVGGGVGENVLSFNPKIIGEKFRNLCQYIYPCGVVVSVVVNVSPMWLAGSASSTAFRPDTPTPFQNAFKILRHF